MSHHVTALIFAILGSTLALSVAEEPQGTRLPRKKLEPFLKEYCIRCHGPEKQKGQVRFDQAAWEITTNDTAQRWQDVLDQLNGGDMPPEDEKQPPTEDLSRTLDTLTGVLLQARRRLTDHGGEIAMRRLNKREYSNTIRDLFGFNLAPHLIPDDGEAESFDTVGEEQFFTSSLFEKYLELGRFVAEQGFQWSGKPHQAVSANRREPEERVTEKLRTHLADLDNKMRMKKEGKSWKEMGFKDAGEAEIIFSQFKNRAGKPRSYLQLPFVETGIYMVGVRNETKRFGTNRGADPRASYRFRVRGGVVGNPPEIRKFLRFSDNDGPVGVVKVKGTPEAPEIVELLVPAKAGYRVQSFQVEENRADIRVLDQYLNRLDPGGTWPSIWVDWLEMEGPFYESDAPHNAFAKIIYPDGYVRGKHPSIQSDQAARQLIERFAFEAFRHQKPGADYVDELVAIFEQNRAEGQPYATAMSEVIGIILSSPGFLFIQEAGASGEKKSLLDQREFAIRLAYFLWSSPPDSELYEADLSIPEELKNQVDRMLDDPRAGAFFEGFASQWADLDRFDAITVDEKVNYRFNKGIRFSAYREVLEFFGLLVKENLAASNLIDSDFVTINSVLAEHYGIPGVSSDSFEKVSLPAESPRGGILGQTAFLTLGSNGERSSPVIRGAIVMEKLLHDKPAPPPPNVPELGAASKTPKSNREMVELHQAQAVCMSCHKKMDVIGFGLENFDTIGKWRDTEKVGRKDIPIEPGGTLPGGAAFGNVSELKKVLLDEEAQLAEELVESLLAYGLGRTIEFSDTDDVADILTKIKPEGYRLRSMVHEIIRNPLFRRK